MQNWARAALAVELVVSWTVGSHHLLSDQDQPAVLQVPSGEMVTAFELVTQVDGVRHHADHLVAGPAAEDDQPAEVPARWAARLRAGRARRHHPGGRRPAPELLPILTKGAELYSRKLANFHVWAHLLSGIGMGAFMGMAGRQGMLRRTIYFEGEYRGCLILAVISGALLLAALAAFLCNIVMTLDLKAHWGSSPGPSWTRRSSCPAPDRPAEVEGLWPSAGGAATLGSGRWPGGGRWFGSWRDATSTSRPSHLPTIWPALLTLAAAPAGGGGRQWPW